VTATARFRAVFALGALVAASACSSEGSSKTIKEVAETVFTLQRGTMTDLKESFGTGPFRDYAVPPAEMIDLVAAVLKTKVAAVCVEPRFGQVIAKERAGKDIDKDEYSPAFRTAVIVFVHPVPDSPGRCRVEIHAIGRGPFHRGFIDWEHEVPPLLDAAVAHRGTTPIRPLK
jgi:hypothetical protein